MSGHPLRLTPPPDYSKAVTSLTIGLTLVLAVYAVTRSTLPTVGDSSHSLPHGGFYKDGTKTVKYLGPSDNHSKHIPLLAVLVIIALIYASSFFPSGRRTGTCSSCGTAHG
uniref:TGB protein 2 n=1 Tax=Opuntia virus X TaxID=253702 RepID=A0A173G3F6_9VIRU|nr:triple gene block gene protein 2 [Opuntia virus X]ATU47238.1 TGB protein 2 [Opuntia virus X]